jgi:hypothetical protein
VLDFSAVGFNQAPGVAWPFEGAYFSSSNAAQRCERPSPMQREEFENDAIRLYCPRGGKR